MIVPFDDMEPNARLWIYQSSKELTPSEVQIIEQESNLFLEQWTTHGKHLKCSATVMENHFLVLSVDEDFTQVSGCSIDSSVRFVQMLGQKLGIDFFNRKNIAFQVDGEIMLIPMSEIPGKVDGGVISQNSLTYNNLVPDKKEFDRQWVTPAAETWLKKYFRSKVDN